MAMENFSFFGHDANYWLELQRKFEEAEPETNVRRAELIQEICRLRMKVSLYESRIDEMADIRNRR